MNSIAWFARNKVAANLLMALILAGGALTIFNLKKEVFPEFSLGLIVITVPYLGAAPEEVEEGVNLRIEEAIQGLDGVKKVTSVASEGVGMVTVELHLGADARKVLDDVKSRVDAIDTFPEETEKPVVREITNRREVIDVAVSGPADEHTLRNLAERVRDDVAALPGVTVVELASARPFEIAIQISEEDLRRHGLTIDFVADAVRRSSLDLPGGSLKSAGGETLVTYPMTGAQIISVLQEQCQPLGSSRPFLHLGVSVGFTYDLAKTITAGNCTSITVSNVRLNGVLLNPAASYNVTVNNFLADGGDNFVTFGTISAARLDGGNDLLAMVNYLGTFSPVSPPSTDRVNELP
jgi:multidrug efflux pump subunit AcrB